MTVSWAFCAYWDGHKLGDDEHVAGCHVIRTFFLYSAPSICHTPQEPGGGGGQDGHLPVWGHRQPAACYLLAEGGQRGETDPQSVITLNHSSAQRTPGEWWSNSVISLSSRVSSSPRSLSSPLAASPSPRWAVWPLPMSSAPTAASTAARLSTSPAVLLPKLCWRSRTVSEDMMIVCFRASVFGLLAKETSLLLQLSSTERVYWPTNWPRLQTGASYPPV